MSLGAETYEPAEDSYELVKVAVRHIGHTSEKMKKATMADLMIYMGQRGLQGWEQEHTTEYKRGMARRGPASAFSLTLRDLLTTYPYDLMRRFIEDMGRFWKGPSSSTSFTTLWSPSIAIFEQEGQIKVCAELPGLNKDDVRVELTQEGLTLRGEHRRESDDWLEGIYRSERSSRSFMRTIPIPGEAQVEKVTATFENEILTVLVPFPSNGPSHRLSAGMWADLERAEALN